MQGLPRRVAGAGGSGRGTRSAPGSVEGSSGLQHYLAYVDGEPVAMGRAAFGDAVFLMGGTCLPEARGRGAYTALVAARWREGGGRPLVAQASTDSQPILRRLGFRETAAIHILADEVPR